MVTVWEVLTRWPHDRQLALENVREFRPIAISLSIGYLVAIFSIRAFMANRKAFDLIWPLRLWNLGMAIFSLGGSLVTGFTLFGIVRHRGLTRKSADIFTNFEDSYCHLDDFFEGPSGYVIFLFFYSKFFEYVDTLFIVLRKKPLIFLHWFHHVLTQNYSLITYLQGCAFDSWIVWINLTIHALMYSYYTARAFQLKIPSVVSKLITSLQIMQFAVTLSILAHIGSIGRERCDAPMLCVVMELMYLGLFVKFFSDAYLSGKRRRADGFREKAE